MPISIHGDATLRDPAGGAETRQLWQLRGYRIGGTVDVVINGHCAKRQRRRGGGDTGVCEIPSIIRIGVQQQRTS